MPPAAGTETCKIELADRRERHTLGRAGAGPAPRGRPRPAARSCSQEGPPSEAEESVSSGGKVFLVVSLASALHADCGESVAAVPPAATGPEPRRPRLVSPLRPQGETPWQPTVRIIVLVIEVRASVATLFLDRPETLNAMGPELFVDLPRALQALDGDEEVRSVVWPPAADTSAWASTSR